MAECPYCFGDIDDRAKKCKHCGEWVSQGQGTARAARPANDPSNDTPVGWARKFAKSDSLDQTLNEGVKLYAGWKVISGGIGLLIFLLFFLFFWLPTACTIHNRMDSFPTNHGNAPVHEVIERFKQGEHFH